MPRKHYDAREGAAQAAAPLNEEGQVLYDVLLVAVNRMRGELGLPAHTREDIMVTRRQVLARQQACQTPGEHG